MGILEKDYGLQVDLSYLNNNYGKLTEGERKLLAVCEKQLQYIDQLRDRVASLEADVSILKTLSQSEDFRS